METTPNLKERSYPKRCLENINFRLIKQRKRLLNWFSHTKVKNLRLKKNIAQ